MQGLGQGGKMQSWQQIKDQLDINKILDEPVVELEKLDFVSIDPKLRPKVDRVKGLSPDQKSMVKKDLQNLLYPETLTPAQRRAMYAEVAARYRQFLGWQGIGEEAPGW
jgi:hypothetical protein